MGYVIGIDKKRKENFIRCIFVIIMGKFMEYCGKGCMGGRF